VCLDEIDFVCFHVGRRINDLNAVSIASPGCLYRIIVGNVDDRNREQRCFIFAQEVANVSMRTGFCEHYAESDSCPERFGSISGSALTYNRTSDQQLRKRIIFEDRFIVSCVKLLVENILL